MARDGMLAGSSCLKIANALFIQYRRWTQDVTGIFQYYDVASDVGVNFKNVGVLSIESSLFHLFHYTFLQTEHQRKGY